MADNTEALIYSISDLQTSLDRMIASQEAFQRDVILLLKEIAASASYSNTDTSIRDAIGAIAQDISVIADRHRVPDYDDD